MLSKVTCVLSLLRNLTLQALHACLQDNCQLQAFGLSRTVAVAFRSLGHEPGKVYNRTVMQLLAYPATSRGVMTKENICNYASQKLLFC